MPDTADKTALEEGRRFTPRFDEAGLIGVIVTDARDGAVLMFAFMNAEALDCTLATGNLHFWSRSRGKLWRKGETSGETLKLVSLATDCDQDVLLISADPQGAGATCHTGRRSCFYRQLKDGELVVTDTQRLFDPAKVYRS